MSRNWFVITMETKNMKVSFLRNICTQDCYRDKPASHWSPVFLTFMDENESHVSLLMFWNDIFSWFRFFRSDGTEVMVDNKFLKANNPLLVIGFVLHCIMLLNCLNQCTIVFPSILTVVISNISWSTSTSNISAILPDHHKLQIYERYDLSGSLFS